jgi:cytosine/adenosine deaminase-related metal-dependent hydrolase
MLLRARIVLPVSTPPIENGAVLISGERIAAVGRWPELRGVAGEHTVDLGDMILLPGLINAHCHLDYTDMAGQLVPGKNFSAWIKSIVTLKAEWSYTEFARSWLNGANMLLRSGTTTVVDIEAVPELVAEARTSTPLRVISCLELLSVRRQRTPRQLVDEAVTTLEGISNEAAGLSPHAPYTTSADLLRAAAAAARERQWLLTTHVAESADEFEMFQHGRGAMFDWLKAQRGTSDCGHCSPVEHLARNGVLGRNFLAVHANYLAPGDAALLAHSQSSVVHCPRSHAFFRHHDFPLAELESAGVNVCLGTDSLATTSRSSMEALELNMFSEMRAFATAFPELPPQRVVENATVRAAHALNRSGELGLLAPNARADLIAIPFAGAADDAAEAVLHHRGQVFGSMIHGRWAIAPTNP